MWNIQPAYGVSPTTIEELLVDNIYMTDGGVGNTAREWIEVEGQASIKRFTLSHAVAKTAAKSERLIHLHSPAKIVEWNMSDIYTEGFEKIMD